MLDIAKLGARYGPDPGTVDPGRALAYAAATNDDSPFYVNGMDPCPVPPLFAVVPTWDTTMSAVHDAVPAEAMGMLVHLSQDMHFVRPLVAGATVHTDARIRAIRARRSGSQILVEVTSRGDDGEVTLVQLATMFIRGLTGGESGGDDAPGHTFPPGARAEPVAALTVHIGADQTFRYAEASGDSNRIHVDDSFAREMGLPGIIVHGMCTMAFCSHTVLAEVAGGDPTLLRRLAVRFSRPVPPDSDLAISLFGAGEGQHRRCFAFEARCRGEVVIKDGWAEIGPPET
ncbi:MAG: MaoC/PaaZ C-terminal domain-containing protein [Acidimicrobiales bacterium]